MVKTKQELILKFNTIDEAEKSVYELVKSGKNFRDIAKTGFDISGNIKRFNPSQISKIKAKFEPKSPENNLISIEEYCMRNLDEQKCDRLKKLGIFAQMMIKKDPNAALEAVRIIVIIAQDVNNETNAGYDSELEYAYFLSNMNIDDFINLEIFEMHDGSYVSLNDISEIECEDKISLLELTIEHIKTEKINLELLDEDFRLIMQNIDEIQNNQCTTMLTSIND